MREVASRQDKRESQEFLVHRLHYRELVGLPLHINPNYRACQLFKQRQGFWSSSLQQVSVDEVKRNPPLITKEREDSVHSTQHFPLRLGKQEKLPNAQNRINYPPPRGAQKFVCTLALELLAL